MKKHQSWFWFLMQLVLGVELIGLLWLIWVNSSHFFSLIGATGATGQVIGLQISIVLVLVAAAIWVGATFRGAIGKKPWVRSSNFTIQILGIAAATGILQGIIGSASVGLVLLVMSLVGIFASAMLISADKTKKDPNDPEGHQEPTK